MQRKQLTLKMKLEKEIFLKMISEWYTGKLKNEFLISLSSHNNGKKDVLFIYFLNYFIHMCLHCLGHFCPLPPPPPSPTFPLQFQAGPVLPLSLALLKRRDKHKKEKVFSYLRIAIQKYS
jgi:hypothetical protein